MTREEILALKPGRELDALVAEIVMKEVWSAGHHPHYSTSWASAGLVLEKMASNGWEADVSYQDGKWGADFLKMGGAWVGHIGISAPYVICIASLLACMFPEE